MVRTLEQLRRDAELNLCDKCYKKYLAFIEPNIKVLIESRLHEWRFTETNITTMVLWHRDAFKTDTWAEVARNEEWGDLHHEIMDKEAFDKTRKMTYGQKIDYLKKKHVIPDACYQLFKEAGNRRNLIHESPMIYNFPEEDLNLFYISYSISSTLIQMIRFNLPEEIKEREIKACETLARKWLQDHKKLNEIC